MNCSTHTDVPAVADALPPIAAALLATTFALLLLRSLLRRTAGQKALWAVGFALFALAAASEAAAQRVGHGATFQDHGGTLRFQRVRSTSRWISATSGAGSG